MTAPFPLPLAGFALAIGLVATSYLAAFLPGGAPAWAPWLLAVGTALALAAVTLLGAERPGRRSRLVRLACLATFLLVAGGFGLALLLPAETTADPLWLGLPRRAAILLYGIGLLPVLVLPVTYAVTFDRATLDDDRLGTLRARVAALRAEADSARDEGVSRDDDGASR